MSNPESIQIEGFTISDPLIVDPIKLTDVKYKDGQLVMILNQRVSQNWIDSISAQNHKWTIGYNVSSFSFEGNIVSVHVSDTFAPNILNQFKEWIATANKNYFNLVIKKLQREKAQAEQQARAEAEKNAKEDAATAALKKLL